MMNGVKYGGGTPSVRRRVYALRNGDTIGMGKVHSF